MSTKYRLAEQVRFKLEGGYPDVAAAVQQPDVYVAIDQLINSLFKTQHYQETLASGETIPNNLMLATYTDVEVLPYNKGLLSYSLLPVIPVSLMRNMGITEVYDENNPQNLFIPLMAGQNILLRSQPLINDLLGQIGYTPYRDRIIYTTNLLLLNIPIRTVSMRLLVFDIDQYDIYTPLPIPRDMENDIVDALVAKFAPVTPEPNLVDNFSTATQKISNKPQTIKT